ncbi:MAG: hypothetical protein LUG51_05845 [Tannerellaceae bacterium]|nr:hypothetical protein [Tannerellaceae bacterium]
MKKLLLILISICLLISCGQNDELLELNQQTSAIFENENLTDAESRTLTLMDPANQVPLYEYSWAEDYYYATQFLGATFYDNNSGHTYSYSRQLGKIAGNLYPYYGLISVINKIAVFYNPSTQHHKVLYAIANSDSFGGREPGDYKVRDLGYTLWTPHPDDYHYLEDGSWKLLELIQNTTTNAYRVTTESETPTGWKRIRSLGLVILK